MCVFLRHAHSLRLLGEAQANTPRMDTFSSSKQIPFQQIDSHVVLACIFSSCSTTPPTFSHLTPIIISEERRARAFGFFILLCRARWNFLKHFFALYTRKYYGERKKSFQFFFFYFILSHFSLTRSLILHPIHRKLRFFLRLFFSVVAETQRKQAAAEIKRIKATGEDMRVDGEEKKINKSVPHERRAHKKKLFR